MTALSVEALSATVGSGLLAHLELGVRLGCGPGACLPYGGSGPGRDRSMSMRGHPWSASPAPARSSWGSYSSKVARSAVSTLFHLRGGRRADVFGEPFAWGAFYPQRERPAVGR